MITDMRVEARDLRKRETEPEAREVRWGSMCAKSAATVLTEHRGFTLRDATALKVDYFVLPEGPNSDSEQPQVRWATSEGPWKETSAHMQKGGDVAKGRAKHPPRVS